MQCGNDRKIELDLARYINKLAADFRSLHEQAWQIPVLIIATISFVLVAYSQISNPGKGFVLIGGSLIVFVLSIVLSKHRFFMDMIFLKIREFEDTNRLD